MGVAKILSANEHAEKLCACAARISTTAKDALALFETETDSKKDQNLIQKVLQSGHSSVIEHITLTIAFQNVSVFAEQFFIEFRLASFMVKSRRYVDFSNAAYYVPTELNETLREKYENHMQFLFAQYERLLTLGIPKEDARFLLPYALGSHFYMTVNARELRHILEAMLYGRGSQFLELRTLGESILAQASALFPGAFSDFTTSTTSNPVNPSSHAGRKPVLVDTKMRVELIQSPSFPEKTLSLAAEMSGADNDIATLLQKEHGREIEQLTYTFWIDRLSLSTITHLTRHRMQSLLVPPLIMANESNVILPPRIAANPDAHTIYTQAVKDNISFISQMEQDGCSRHILVYTLLSGTTLDVLTTMNLRELNLFLKLRVCNRAQWEIRSAAEQLLQKLRSLSPSIFNHFGPSCFVNGKCPEGKLTCGKMGEVVKQYHVND